MNPGHRLGNVLAHDDHQTQFERVCKHRDRLVAENKKLLHFQGELIASLERALALVERMVDRHPGALGEDEFGIYDHSRSVMQEVQQQNGC